MSKKKVTGKTLEEVEELRSEYDGDEPFEQHYCLAKIPNQPPDYQGPDRYCYYSETHQRGSNWLCKHHGGKGSHDPDNCEKLAAMTHGMTATQENLLRDFDEKDTALYNWIMSEWPEAYDISLEEDPTARYDFHRLATEIVRGERGRGHLIEEGEITENERYSEDGSIIIDDSGEVVTEKSEHYLAGMLDRQDRKITSLEKELGISRKERLRQDSTDDAVESIKGLAQLGSAFLSREENEYNSDDAPWEEDPDESDG